MTKTPPAPEQNHFFFLAAAQVSYRKSDGTTGVHVVNTMLDSNSSQIRAHELDAITQASHSRAAAEMQVELKDVLYVTILNIQLLSYCTREQFHSRQQVPDLVELNKGMH